MARIAQLLSEVPKRLKTQFEPGIVKAADSLNAELQQTLGAQGTRSSPSKPGEPPRRQTGELQRVTKATANPATLSITIITTDYGRILNLKARPWLKAALERNQAARRNLIYGR